MAVYNEKNKSKWTKDGRHWYFVCYYKNIYGERKQKVSKMYFTKKEAEEAELVFLSKREHPARIKFTILAKSYFEYLSTIRKSSTVNSYIKDSKNHIMPYFQDYFVDDINIQVIRLWAEEMDKKHLSIAYKNKIYNILCKIFDYAIRQYDLNNNPARAFGCFQQKQDTVVRDEDKIRYITFDEFNKFLSVINDLRDRTFFIFAYYTGCRRGEIQAITWEDINFNTKEISINKTLYEETAGKVDITSTKNNQNRKIKMSKFLVESLLIYKNEVKKYADFKESWFVFGNTRFLPKTTINRHKDYYFKLSGVHRITMHEFRHSHVSLLINEYIKQCHKLNIKIDTVKFFTMASDRLGHTIQVMIETYLHLFPTVQDEIVDILDNLVFADNL